MNDITYAIDPEILEMVISQQERLHDLYLEYGLMRFADAMKGGI